MFPLHFVTAKYKDLFVIFWVLTTFWDICTHCNTVYSYQHCNVLAGGERAASSWHHYCMSALIISGKAVWLTENCIIGVLGDLNCTNRDNQDNTPCLSCVLQPYTQTHTHTHTYTGINKRTQETTTADNGNYPFMTSLSVVHHLHRKTKCIWIIHGA